MKKALALCTLLPLAAAAGDFDRRVADARAAIATPAGHAYDMALVPAIHAATTKCVPPGRRAAERSDSFTTVASVDRSGRVSRVEVRPVTALSQCFAGRLAAMRLQPPPPGRHPHPILIEIRDRF